MKTKSKSLMLQVSSFLVIYLFVFAFGSFRIAGVNKNDAAPSGVKSVNKYSAESSFTNKDVRTNSVGMNMVRIKSGSFFMGSDEGEYDEKPVHKVNISSPFYMSATPVTNAQYEQFDPHHRLLRGKRGLSREDDEAAVYISWYDAVAFTQWLSLKEGIPYRLPTEAEWEYACRAGTETPYSTGDILPDTYHLNQNNERYPEEVSLAVGKTPPNQWGLYNMHGLVEEWCVDWYGPYVATEQNDPVGYVDGDARVTRGGSHNTVPEYLRSANRMGMIPEDKHFLTGFRVVQAEMPESGPLVREESGKWAEDVDQSDSDWHTQIVMSEPYFAEPVYFQKIPPESNGPLYSQHNHCPDITPLPNGDLFATWYTTKSEPGRYLAVAVSRLRKGADQWDEPSLFHKIPDRNLHTTAVWWDRSGSRVYHFQGVAVGYHWGDLALFMRTSDDNGVTWSKPHWINNKHGIRNMPVAGVIKTADGSIIVPCDAVVGGSGGTALHISRDNGITWHDPGAGAPKPVFEEGKTGGWIAGIHAGVVELKDGSLMALGRGDNIHGNMPMSISRDMGKTWAYSASPFPPVSGGQRLVLMRLNEGPLLLATLNRVPGSHSITRQYYTPDIKQITLFQPVINI
jgi:formylglycine-generating enzyme